MPDARKWSKRCCYYLFTFQVRKKSIFKSFSTIFTLLLLPNHFLCHFHSCLNVHTNTWPFKCLMPKSGPRGAATIYLHFNLEKKNQFLSHSQLFSLHYYSLTTSCATFIPALIYTQMSGLSNA